MADILVIFHSVGGYTFRMAEAVAEGISSLSGCEANLKQITEPPGAEAILLPKVDNRKSDFSHIPVVRVEDLEDCDGLAIGTPVFWGNMSSATKYFFEQTMKLWTLPPEPVEPPQFLRCMPATVFTAGGSGHANELAPDGFNPDLAGTTDSQTTTLQWRNSDANHCSLDADGVLTGADNSDFITCAADPCDSYDEGECSDAPHDFCVYADGPPDDVIDFWDLQAFQGCFI